MKKEVKVNYTHMAETEANEIIEEVFENIITRLLLEKRELRIWRRSEEYKKLCQQLIEEKSMLADFILPS